MRSEAESISQYSKSVVCCLRYEAESISQYSKSVVCCLRYEAESISQYAILNTLYSLLKISYQILGNRINFKLALNCLGSLLLVLCSLFFTPCSFVLVLDSWFLVPC